MSEILANENLLKRLKNGALMDRANARSMGKRWKREDLYDV